MVMRPLSSFLARIVVGVDGSAGVAAAVDEEMNRATIFLTEQRPLRRISSAVRKEPYGKGSANRTTSRLGRLPAGCHGRIMLGKTPSKRRKRSRPADVEGRTSSAHIFLPRPTRPYLPEGAAEPMLDQEIHHVPTVVRLPAEIDLTNAEDVCGQLDTAFTSGAQVVIADFTGCTFCDCSSMRRLVGVQARAARRGCQLRLVIPPGNPVRRIAALIEVDRSLPVHPSAREAAVYRRPPGPRAA